VNEIVVYFQYLCCNVVQLIQKASEVSSEVEHTVYSIISQDNNTVASSYTM